MIKIKRITHRTVTARREKGLTQEQMADKVGCTRQHYQMVETGVRRPSVKLAKKIGDELGFSWTAFFEKEI